MTNALHLHNRRTLEKHQDSIMASLNHRLAIARATNNANLVVLLEQEKRQVEPKTPLDVALGGNWWQTLTQYLTDKIFGGSALQVVEIADGRDRWWVASDPQTGQVVYADSEAELRLWIEENYQGK
ncbi:MAG: hypothetical protein KME42_27745 [Tildeniella nuda ZEHNDER 1965/U140]|jgi:hypothetical protein|nr:hypothetical protein [Tildeniella nuda ZEHNDER 1965/U140]